MDMVVLDETAFITILIPVIKSDFLQINFISKSPLFEYKYINNYLIIIIRHDNKLKKRFNSNI